jgi:hypothetical protein
MLPHQLLLILTVATMAALVSMAVLPVLLGWVVVPHVLRHNRARLRRNLVPLGFVDHDEELRGSVDGVPMKVRHHIDAQGEVVDILAWGLPPQLEIDAESVGPPHALRWATRFVGPARGRAWLTPPVEEGLKALAQHGKLEIFDGLLSLSAPVNTRVHGHEAVLVVARFVRRVLDQDVVPLDKALPTYAPEEQLRVLRYATRRDELRGSTEALELARALLDGDAELDPMVWERCVVHTRNELGLLRLCSDPTRPMAVRRHALELIPDDFLAIGIAGVVALREPTLWTRALQRARASTDPVVLRAMLPLLESAVFAGHLETDGALARAMADLLRAHADTEEIPMSHLRPLLDVERSAVRLAALRIVGSVGTVDDVADLRRREAVASGTLRYALQRAVARIQQRAAGDAGGLALAPALPSGGDVSLAPARGEVALAVEA